MKLLNQSPNDIAPANLPLSIRLRFQALLYKIADRGNLLERAGLGGMLLAALALYTIGLSKSGYANSFYAAAVQAASTSWKAWFFGSLDASNFITVDKPPMATMIMGLFTRIFGFSSFTMLLASALAGVATVWLTYAMVRRIAGTKSAFIASGLLMLTPVAALMFRFNNPDSFLTMFLAASGYTFIRALENKRALLWLSLTGVMVGCAFNTKMLQGLIVLPAMAIAYLFFAKPKFVKRLWHLVVAGLVTTVSSLWWAVAVWLIPASNRPYIGSSTDNSIWNLIFGYNGLGRLLGSGSGMGGGMRTGGTALGQAGQTIMQRPTGGNGMGPGSTGFGGQTGVLRIFNADFGPNIGWLIPLALISAIFSLWLLRRAKRGDTQRAAIVMLLGWVVLHIIVFSMTSGVIHPYYPIVMAPAIAALIGIAAPYLWRAARERLSLAWVPALATAATGLTAAILLGYANNWPWLTLAVALAGVAGAVGLLVYKNLVRPLRAVTVGVSLFACLAGPVTFTVSTAAAAHTGSIPTSGPSATAIGQTNNETSQANAALVSYLLAHRGSAKWIVAVASANESAPIQLTSGQPVMAVGGFNGSDNALSVDQLKQLVATGQLQYYAVSTSGRGGMGGNSELQQWVEANGTVVNYGGSGTTLYKLNA